MFDGPKSVAGHGIGTEPFTITKDSTGYETKV
jgi:hypothetical protein